MPMGQKDVYDFSWDDLGDVEFGRPNLGSSVPVTVYRLMQYTFRDVLSKELGMEQTKALFVKAGRLAGENFCGNVLNPSLPLDAFIAELQEKLIALGIGVLRVEEHDAENMTLVVTVSEDLDCSGLPFYGETVCDYDEGFLAGVLSVYTKTPFEAVEIDCWSTGDRTCRFRMNPVNPNG